MNSILRKLSGPPRSLGDVADLIEKHLGDGTNALQCKEALDAMRRIREDHPSYYFRVALRALDGAGEPCERVRHVIATLRKWHHFSGA